MSAQHARHDKDNERRLSPALMLFDRLGAFANSRLAAQKNIDADGQPLEIPVNASVAFARTKRSRQPHIRIRPIALVLDPSADILTICQAETLAPDGRPRVSYLVTRPPQGEESHVQLVGVANADYPLQFGPSDSNRNAHDIPSQHTWQMELSQDPTSGRVHLRQVRRSADDLQASAFAPRVDFASLADPEDQSALDTQLATGFWAPDAVTATRAISKQATSSEATMLIATVPHVAARVAVPHLVQR